MDAAYNSFAIEEFLKRQGHVPIGKTQKRSENSS